MFSVTHGGSFKNTEKFLSAVKKIDYRAILEKYGKAGVAALASATPIDSGLTANSWGYEIQVSSSKFSITWTNTNVINGVPVAILIQYGHGTQNGGYVQGRDYINPALRPIFEKISRDVWKEVNRQ